MTDSAKYQNLEYLPSYGRKQTRPLTQKLKAAYDKLPQCKITCEQVKNIKQLSKNYNSVELEIGFGNGEHLAHLAVSNKSSYIIGSEIFINGIAHAVYNISKNNLDNVRIYDNDCRKLLKAMPDGSLDKIYILFPDPWPKERHHKRRIINKFMLNLMQRKLKQGGVVRFASDIEDYYNSATEKFQQDRRYIQTLNSKEKYQIPEGHIKTKYQAKAEKEKRTPHFFEFKKL